jgi:hypothetical protein
MQTIFYVKELREQLSRFSGEDMVTIEIHDALVGEDLYQFNVDAIEHYDEEYNVTFNEVRLCLIPNK